LKTGYEKEDLDIENMIRPLAEKLVKFLDAVNRDGTADSQTVAGMAAVYFVRLKSRKTKKNVRQLSERHNRIVIFEVINTKKVGTALMTVTVSGKGRRRPVVEGSFR
jgi:hypothetical protein